MSILKNVAKMYCKKNPVKVATTVGAVVLAPTVLGVGLVGTVAAGVGGFVLGNKLEKKNKNKDKI